MKNCGTHSDSRAVADCSVCGKPLCLMCVEEKPEGTFCSDSCADARRLQLRAQATVADAPPGLCAKHPESPSVARCKVCEKGACLLCLVETPEGTFCSSKCLEVLSEVKGWVDEPREAARPAPVPAAPIRRDSPPPRAVPALVEPEPEAVPARSGASRVVAMLLAAAALVVIGVVAIRESAKTAEGPGVAAKEPSKPVVVKPEPKPEPRPEAKPAPPVVRPDPPKPETKPVVANPEPKPEPKPEAKPEPKPAPPVVRPDPPKPETKPVAANPEPKPEPRPEAKPEPKPDPPKPRPSRHLLRAADPWIDVRPGAWYRVKRTEGGQETFTDLGLKERGGWYTVVASQSRRAKAEPEQHRWIEVSEARSTGELKLEQLSVDLVSLQGREREVFWVVREGAHEGVVLKQESADRRVQIAKVEPDRLTVKDRSFACLRVEVEEGGTRIRRWLSAEVPLPAVRTERDGMTETLVDFGTDWSKRPPFPAPEEPIAKPPVPPKVEPPKPKPAPPPPVPVAKPDPPKEKPKPDPPKEDPSERQKKLLAEAAAKVRDATPLYREVAAADPLPSEPAERKALLARAESANRLLREAKTIYLDAKAASDDPAILERRITQIDSLLAALGKRMAVLEEGLR